MKVKEIRVVLETLGGTAGTGTTDPVYLGVIGRFGGREFPLRYQKAGLVIEAGMKYEFGISAADLPANLQIYDSLTGGRNSISTYGLIDVSQVYIRKQPVRAAADGDDSLGIHYVAAFITQVDGVVVDWNNRNQPDSSGPSPLWLGNEYGQAIYLKRG